MNLYKEIVLYFWYFWVYNKHVLTAEQEGDMMRDITDYEKKYMEDPFEETISDIRRRCVLGQIGDTNQKSILEVGCGMHPLFLDIENYQTMVIVEPGSDFCKNAEKTDAFQKAGSRIRILQGFLEERTEDILHLNINFDTIIVSSLLHEVEDPKKLLSSVRAVCADNTIVHINVPNARSLHRLIAYESGMISSLYEKSALQKSLQQHSTYDMELLINDVKEAGFDVISQGSYFIKPFTHSQMQRMLDENIISGQVLDGLEKLTRYLPEYGADIYVNVKRA